MAFATRITVNFGDTDPAGLVYFPNIFHYCHIAMERFFEEVCRVPYSTIIDDQLGFPTVKLDAEFKSPLRYSDVIEITLSVSAVGNKSLSFSYILKNASGTVCAEVSQVVVAMNLETKSSVSIPDSIRRHLT